MKFSLWARVIAGIQMLTNLLGLILGVMSYFRLETFMRSYKISASKKEMIEIFEGVRIILYLLCFILAVVLLVGISNRMIQILYTWLIFNCLFMALEIVGTILEYTFVHIVMVRAISQCVGSTTIRAIGILVVGLLVKEIQIHEMETKTSGVVDGRKDTEEEAVFKPVKNFEKGKTDRGTTE